MRGRVRRGPIPVDAIGLGQLFEKHLVQPAPARSHTPISAGKYSQGMPVFTTNRIPVSAARSDTRGRAPLGFGGSGGSSGAIRAHNASGNSSFAMAPSSMAPMLERDAHLAAAIIRGLAKGVPCLFHECWALLKDVQASFDRKGEATEAKVLEPVYEAEIIVLDELGAS